MYGVDPFSFFFLGNRDCSDHLLHSGYQPSILRLPCLEPFTKLDDANPGYGFHSLVGKFVANIVAFLIFWIADSCFGIFLGGMTFDFSERLIPNSSFDYG